MDNPSLRSLMGLDTLGASQILRRLLDRGLLELHARGSQSFYTLAPRLRSAESADRGEQGLDRGEQLRQVIAQLCAGHWRPPTWLAEQLKMEAGNLSERHLAPMVNEGILERRYPERPTHPEQAYCTAWIQNSLLLSTFE